MIKLQLALDNKDLRQSLALAREVHEYVDIIEIGTPLVYQAGLDAVSLFRQEFPHKEILADMKIMDAGYYEASQGFEAGADYVTVLAVTDSLTIDACVKAAEAFGKKVVADMICIKDREDCVKRLEGIGVHGMAIHIGTDQQAAGMTPLAELHKMKECCKKTDIFVAGGIKEASAMEYVQAGPQVLIVGNGISGVPNPKEAAKKIKEYIWQKTDIS